MLKDLKTSIKLDSDASSASSKQQQLFSLLLGASTELHLFHLKVESYAQHKAIGDLYESIQNQADQIIEVYQGIHGLIDIKIPSCTAPTNIESYLKRLRTTILNNKDSFEDMPDLQNVIDEVAAGIARTLYKIRFLK